MARNKHPEVTVKLILDTAARLFTQKGYEKTSLQDIINETHLSKGAIYHHFTNKEDLFIKMCERIGDENTLELSKVRDDTSLNGMQKLKHLFREALLQANQKTMIQMVPYLLDSPKFLIIQIRSLFDEVVPFFIKPILEEGIADGSIQTQHPQELGEAIIVLADIWLHPLLKPSSPEATKARCQVFQTLLLGVGLDLIDDEIIDAYVAYSKMLVERDKR